MIVWLGGGGVPVPLGRLAAVVSHAANLSIPTALVEGLGASRALSESPVAHETKKHRVGKCAFDLRTLSPV